jgi:FkbM family methyltransferase
LVQALKTALVKRGSGSLLTRAFLVSYAVSRGFRIQLGDAVSIRKGASILRIPTASLYMVPYMMKYFDAYFNSLDAIEESGIRVLDFSKPNFHRYTSTGTGFYFPSIPEEEFGREYIRSYRPKAGDVVFDLGANAGATTYFLSKMVGDDGKVYAFEPDDCNYEFLLRNIAHHRLKNVVPVKKAIGGSTGTAAFHMDGTLASGLADLVAYSGVGMVRTVETLTLAEACREFNVLPSFIKMDVEGAEIAVVSQSRDFLKANPIHFAIDSCHFVGGEMTCGALDRLFAGIGYGVRSCAESGSMFTWAAPPGAPEGVPQYLQSGSIA